MATYVLVGGQWIGGWAWQQVARDLRGRGHDVYPLTLTGLGERAHLARPEVDLETHITDVLSVLAYEDLAAVVLVGHSYGGNVVSGVADRVPERVGELVYVDSGPLGDGVAQIDFSSPEGQAALRRRVEEEGDGWRLPMPSFSELEREGASLAGLDDAARARMRAKAVPQPFGSVLQPLRLTRTFAGEYGRTVVLCSEGGFTVAAVRAAIASGEPGLAQAFADPDWRFAELPTGHWPMLSMPAELARVLADVPSGASG